MHEAHEHSARCRAPLVRVVDLRPRGDLPTVDTRDAYVAGLRFAWLLRERFPEFFAAHVARLPPWPENLLGVMSSFLSLAHTRLVQIDVDAHLLSGSPMNYYGHLRWAFKPKTPRDALIWWHSRRSSLSMLANEGTAWLARPIPKVYGISVESELDLRTNGRTIDTGLFALTIWKLVSATSWSVLPVERINELVNTRARNDLFGRAIAALEPLPADTPLVALCAALDRASPVGLPRLGTIIAYVCTRTGNRFADQPTAALRQDNGHQVFDLAWLTSNFQELKRQQDQAQTWRRSLSNTQGRFFRTWQELLPLLRDALRTAAEGVSERDWGTTNGTSVYQPDALCNLIWSQP